MRHLLFTILMFTLCGIMSCGGGTEPDVPATLTPEQEQEILDHVEKAAAEEEGTS